MHDRATAPEAVDRAFADAPRTGFLPRAQQPHAHEDQPLEIGYGQTSSQPSTVRRMLRLLDVAEGQRMLDVGSGSGWTTTLLAYLVGPAGEVVGVELLPDLALWGASNLAAHPVPWAQHPPRGARAFSAGRTARRTTGCWSPRRPTRSRTSWSSS